MLVLLLAVLLAIVAAAAVVAYVAYAHHGRTVPRASWLSRALQGAVDRAGLDPDDDEAAHGGSLTSLQQQWSEKRAAERELERESKRASKPASGSAAGDPGDPVPGSPPPQQPAHR